MNEEGTDNVSFGDIVRTIASCLSKVTGENIVSRPSWIDNILNIDPENWTFNTITPGMQKEFSAVMDLSVSRLEIELEELNEEQKEIQSKIDKVIDTIDWATDLKVGTVVCFEDLIVLKKELA